MGGVWQLWDTCSNLLGLCSGWASCFSDGDIYSVVVQCTVSVPTCCTGSDLLDSSVISEELIKNSIH